MQYVVKRNVRSGSKVSWQRSIATKWPHVMHDWHLEPVVTFQPTAHACKVNSGTTSTRMQHDVVLNARGVKWGQSTGRSIRKDSYKKQAYRTHKIRQTWPTHIDRVMLRDGVHRQLYVYSSLGNKKKQASRTNVYYENVRFFAAKKQNCKSQKATSSETISHP